MIGCLPNSLALRAQLPARQNRFKRLMMVEIIDSAGEVFKVSTSNLSFSGMAVIGQTSLEPGDHIRVRISSLGNHSARVAWRRERRIGLSFDRDLDLIGCLGPSIRPVSHDPS
ncbi:PilZ domain-containing protein [Novosphingobium sp. MW5]|nr:PilZ domain-containing protein [Novosphingobium sp. MW5]